jgi:hypothetical protein
MEMKLSLALRQQQALMKVSATVQDPEVHLLAWQQGVPVLCIEDGGVAIEIEFTDPESLLGFQQRIANLQLPGEQRV